MMCDENASLMCDENESCEPSSLSSMPVLEEEGEPFEAFVCQICLDILYKPIVQACGHVLCFWCARRSMNQSKPSQCPVCRRPYMHFPRVCQLLHFFLTKAWPQDYKRKANEIQAMEESTKIFSPRILTRTAMAFSCMSPAFACGDHQFPELAETIATVDQKLWNINRTQQSEVQIINVVDEDHSAPEQRLTSDDQSEQHEIASVKASEASTEIKIEDFSCICCGKLLYRPVVLNCGEVLCESCACEELTRSADPGSNPSCPSCRSVHPSGPLGVCLALHLYLKRAFPSHYSQRKEEVELRQRAHITTPLPAAPAVDSDELDDDDDDDIDDKRGFVHIGAGCDGCGMFPIVGHRYHCRDCGEQVGYDLCGSCYSVTGSGTSSNYDHSPVGRFNQEHSPEHRMEEMVSERRAPFNTVVQYLNVAPLNFNLENGTISRRRQQQILDDFDDYIDSFV